MNSTVTDRKIKIIPPKVNMNIEKKKKVKKINVAAYCRVSTAQEDQETSYEAQVAYFTKLITENPSWQLAGIYADDGISGTDMKKRDNFNALMDARERDSGKWTDTQCLLSTFPELFWLVVAY